MSKTDNFISIYSGFEVNAQHLQNVLEEKGIDSIIQNDSESALRAGFGNTQPGQVRLLVPKSQQDKAKQIIENIFPEQETE